MLQTSDGETEILLGNKQLLGIFFVVVILLGVAFAGGYKVGQSSKKAGNSVAATDQSAGAASTAAETHSVAPEPAPAGSAPVESEPPAQTPAPSKPQAAAATKEDSTPLLGSKAAAKSTHPQPDDPEAPGPSPVVSGHDSFTPQAGETFLQVAAVGRDEAEGISDVLRKKGFRAHAVPKPGNAKLYRVIIGPMRDPSDLNNTRNSLRNTGFREIIVQKY
jgi:cell division septation protein DedD